MKTVVITSWYFNPLHPWHIDCFEQCKALWDELRVIVNNDAQVQAKTWMPIPYQDEQFRLRLVSALKPVDRAMLAVDQVDATVSVCESIRFIAALIRDTYGPDTQIIFGKWWDRFASNIPEVAVCQELAIEIKDGLWAKTHNSNEYRNKI